MLRTLKEIIYFYHDKTKKTKIKKITDNILVHRIQNFNLFFKFINADNKLKTFYVTTCLFLFKFEAKN